MMKAAIGLILILAAGLSGPAAARPTPNGGPLPRLQYLDLAVPAQDSPGAGNPGVFGTAQAGTTYFGGTVWAADSARWEAIPGQLWTFDTGVGSSIVGEATLPAGWVNPFKVPGYHASMEGWLGVDLTYSDLGQFRRLASTDPRWGTICVGSTAGLGGTYSFWCGVFASEAQPLCYFGGQGYGNSWNKCIEHGFTYGGGSVTLGFAYKNDTEQDYDYSVVYVDTSGLGDIVEVAAYTGTLGGTASIPLTQGIELPAHSRPIKIKFCFESDGAWSDEDGLNPTVCGAFAVDNITVSGGGITHIADFEAEGTPDSDGEQDGWVVSSPVPGKGGEWSNLYHLSDLPAPLTPCACALTDTVLALADDSNGHNQFQANMAVSPWIDLKAAGMVGAPGKILRGNLYTFLPLRNYVFMWFRVQWYPEVCTATGKLLTSAWADDGFVYYGAGVPTCTALDNTLGFQRDYSTVIPPGAEQTRMAVTVVSWCQFFANCTQASNTTPWFDMCGLGVYGTPGAPYIYSNTMQIPMDNFPENGTLNINAAGRLDPTGGDTLSVQGGFGGAEVYVHFRVTPGPGVNVSAFNTWYNRHAASAVEPGFKVARMDTAEQGDLGPTRGRWMAAYHESDPNFAGTDRDLDPTDVAPNGGIWRLKNDIFPDDLFTMGTRVDIAYACNIAGQTAYFRIPSPGTYYEAEILPASATAGGEWNCVLYVDHYGREGAQGYIENALTGVLGTGSENYERTNWDRFDVNAPSSGARGFGRPLQAEYGASVIQSLGYKVILWSTGALFSLALERADADILNPWLTLLDFDFNNLYLTGDGVVASAIYEAESAPSARRLIEDLAGVTLRTDCSTGTYREANCPAGAPQDLTACVNLDPVAGAPVAGSLGGRVVDHTGQGNGCPQLRSFDVLTTLIPDFGTSVGDERYSSAVKTADFASIATDASTGGVLNYKIVSDGVSIHNRRDEGTPCNYTLGGAASVRERLDEVLSWFGYGSAVVCEDPTAGTGRVDDGGQRPSFQTSLGGFAPNPLMAGKAGRIQFTMSRDGRATIGIYDIEGRLVKSVFSGVAQAGMNEVVWDGTDESGIRVAGGVYFYRLRAGDQDISKKLVLVPGGGE